MSRAIRENRFVYAFFGLWREIQSSEGGGQAEPKAFGLEIEGETTPSEYQGWLTPLLTPSQGPKATHRGGKTSNPSGKLVVMSFLSGKPGLDSSS